MALLGIASVNGHDCFIALCYLFLLNQTIAKSFVESFSLWKLLAVESLIGGWKKTTADEVGRNPIRKRFDEVW